MVAPPMGNRQSFTLGWIFMTKHCLLVLAFCISGSVPESLCAQDVTSYARGLAAAKQLVRSKSRCDELEVSPDQLAKIVDFLNSEEVRKAPRKNPLQVLGARADFAAEDFGFVEANAGQVLVDDLVATKLAQILYPAQLDKMRIDFIKKHTRFPLGAFDLRCLVQLGMPDNEIEELVPRVKHPSVQILGKMREVRAKTIAALLADFPDKSTDKFVRCFGREYLPSSLEEFHESAIGICTEDRGTALLDSFLSLVLAKDIAPIAAEEFSAINKAISELTFKHGDPQFDYEKAGFEAAFTLLTPSQRLAASHKVHLMLLESDLKIIVRPELARYLELPAELLPVLRTASAEKQENLDSMRLEMETVVFRETYNTLSRDSKILIRQLYNSVWCELK